MKICSCEKYFRQNYEYEENQILCYVESFFRYSDAILQPKVSKIMLDFLVKTDACLGP